MALSDITREAVVEAMREYDELGADQFLAKYGFAPARKYRVAELGRQYDSKAIAGVAHGYATGHTLTSSEFVGGQDTVVKTLVGLGFRFAPIAADQTRAWLVLAKLDYRRLGGSTTYDDDASSHYSYDSNVANSQQVSVGDRLVLWDETTLIGASTVASISERPGTKLISRCPNCTRTNFEPRKTMTPRFRCGDCHYEFEEPKVTEVDVTLYQTDHSQGWVDLGGMLDGAFLRTLTGYSQNSIRRINDWNEFAFAIEAVAGSGALTPVKIAQSQVIAGGHAVRQVNVRIGQPAFRAELIRKHGHVCAFSGPAPAEALEACHLYSYAEIGRHEADGGLLLRRDLHRLFDRGLLAVTEDGTVDVADSLTPYPLYAALHGQPLLVMPTVRQKAWLAAHWAEWRTGSAG
jgi:ribosomal protein S27AE